MTAADPPSDPPGGDGSGPENPASGGGPDGRRGEDSLVEAFADRHEIDWEAALARARGAGQRSVLANLRRLARIARRTEAPSLPASRGALARDPSRSLASWEWAVVLVAGGHVALGLLGGLLGVPDELPLPVWVPMLGLPCAAAAAWLLVVGREDRRAERLGGAFLLAGAAFAMRPASWLLGADSALLAATPDAFGGVFLWNFAREFPRPRKLSRQERWLEVGARVAVLLATVLFFANLLAQWVPLPGALPLLLREHPGNLYWYVVLLTGGAALSLSMARTRSAATLERERFTLFLGGILLGLGPLFLEVLMEAGSSGFAAWMSRPGPTFWGGALFFVCLCAMAVSTSYAVASWRMFGVRLLIRRALVRWLVKTALVIAILVLPAVAYELVRGRPLLDELPSGRATVVLLILVVVVVLIKDWLVRVLDRTMFRDALLHEDRVEDLTERMRLVRSLAELEALLEAKLGVDVGARHVILFAEQRLSRSASFRPARGRGDPLPAASPLATLACEGELPLPTAPGESGSSYHWLSPDDQAWLGEHDLALLAPIRDSSGEVIALIGVGPRRGGRSYEDDELLLVRDLAVTTSMIIENLKLRTGSGELPNLAFDCDACGRVSPESDDPCECGERRWSPARLPYRFADKFRLERVLGRGGMGVVYRAMDETLQRRVALKTLPRVGRRDAQRLREEARRMASIDHPHLARIHGLEAWAGVPVLVMEYLSGGTLAGRLGAAWTWRDALQLGSALCDALIAMHGQGVVHRDVKPSNIGFASDETPKLLDFGLARLPEEASDDEEAAAPRLGSADSVPQIAGTLLYLPPEALRNVDPRETQDLWALAMTLHQMIAARHPLAGREAEAQLRRGEMPSIPRLADGYCPEPVAGFLARALDPDPAARPDSAVAFRDELRTLTS